MSAILVLLLTAAVGGCGDGATQGLDPSGVDQAYGGLTVRDEAPEFGESQTFVELGVSGEDPLSPDAYDSDPAVTRPDGSVKNIRFLALGWGNLRRAGLGGEPGTTEVHDYSGSISVSEGAVIVLRRQNVIRRLLGDGILPRTDIRSLAWKSTIYEGIDGLLLMVVAPGGATVEIRVGGAQVTAMLDDAVPVDQSSGDVPGSDGQYAIGVVSLPVAAASATSAHPESLPCRGYLVGRWHNLVELNGEPAGLFHGRWLGPGGRLFGHVRGLFGKRADGEEVLYAKVIDTQGRFQGLLLGRYADDRFLGQWLDAHFQLAGRIQGLYFEKGDVDIGRVGSFLGTWRQLSCGE